MLSSFQEITIAFYDIWSNDTDHHFCSSNLKIDYLIVYDVSKISRWLIVNLFFWTVVVNHKEEKDSET